MQKPFDLNVIDTKKELYKVVQGARLPLVACIWLLSDMLTELKASLPESLEAQKKDYEKMLKESEKNGNNSKDPGRIQENGRGTTESSVSEQGC